MLRMERGGSGFLGQVTRHLVDHGADEVFSPALFPESTRIWRENGYQDHVALDVFERSLSGRPGEPTPHVVASVSPNWAEIVAVDRKAFAGFWGMSETGLKEAYAANRSASVLTVEAEGSVVGYAIVGSHWGVAYLHRIAVEPSAEGRGFGRSLLSASLNWGAANGGRVMVLNVRPDNERARRVYERVGFMATGTSLSVLRHQPG